MCRGPGVGKTLLSDDWVSKSDSHTRMSERALAHSPFAWKAGKDIQRLETQTIAAGKMSLVCFSAHPPVSALPADILDASQKLSRFPSWRAVDPERLSNLFKITQPVRVWLAMSLYLTTRNHSLLLASSGWGQRWEWWWRRGQKKCCLFFFFLIIILEQSWKNQGTREVDLEGTAPKAFGPVASVVYF